MKALRLMNVIPPVLAASTTVSAGPVLLASFSGTTGNSLAPHAADPVQFILEMRMDNYTTSRFRLGEGIFWEDGEQGDLAFTPGNSEDFAGLAELSTDGINGHYTLFSLWADGQGGGPGGYESRLFDRYPHLGEVPDLYGFELTSVRLIVHDVTIEPWFPDSGNVGATVLGTLTYEFYGAPVPDPGTLVLLGSGACVLRWRRLARRRAF